MRTAAPLLCLSLRAACGGAPASKLNVGAIAPTFQTYCMDGAPAHYPAAFAGRPLVIRCRADGCRFCAAEMTVTDALWRRRRTQGLEVLAINAGQDVKTVAAFAAKVGVGYPVLLDEKSAMARSHGVVGLPTTHFVDARGIVRGTLVGKADAATFERHVLQRLP